MVDTAEAGMNSSCPGASADGRVRNHPRGRGAKPRCYRARDVGASETPLDNRKAGMLVISNVVLVSTCGADCFSKITRELCRDTSKNEPLTGYEISPGSINDVVRQTSTMFWTWTP